MASPREDVDGIPDDLRTPEYKKDGNLTPEQYDTLVKVLKRKRDVYCALRDEQQRTKTEKAERPSHFAQEGAPFDETPGWDNIRDRARMATDSAGTNTDASSSNYGSGEAAKVGINEALPASNAFPTRGATTVAMADDTWRSMGKTILFSAVFLSVFVYLKK